MRIPVSLIFVFIWVGVTLVPDIIMAMQVPIQVSLVLEMMITAPVLAHETGVRLMSYPVLFQPTFEQKTLATVFTNKMKVIVHVHVLVQCSASCKFFITQVTVYHSVIFSVMII